MSDREPTFYSERQTVRQRYTGVLLALPPAAMLFITLRQVIWHKPWFNPPTSDGGLIFLTVLLVAVYFRLMTVKLVTELHPGEIAVELRGMWRRSRIPLAEVRSVEAVSYNPARDFGGYGVRTTRAGRAYIARGNRAVRLVLANGERIWIGSQNAAELTGKILDLRKQARA